MVRKLLLKLMQIVTRIALSLRYKIEIRGKDVLSDPRLREKGILVLPNHAALIDPFILMAIYGFDTNLCPLVTEKYYNYPFANFFMRLARVKPVAQFDTAISEYKIQSAEKLFKSVVDDLKNGAHILLYPSAALKVTPEEKVGGRSLAYQTVQEAPETEILLVRTTGLWGSMFSKAYTKDTPEFWDVFLRGIKIALKNGIFFMPRRKVTIEFALAGEDFPKHGSKAEFNQALEQFYNQYRTNEGQIVDKEPLSTVSYGIGTNKVSQLPIKKYVNPQYHDFSVPNHIKQDIFYQLSELSGKSVRDIHEEDDLIYDIGIDSLGVAEIYSYIDAHYEMEKGVEPGDLKTVQDLLACAMHLKKGERKEELKKRDIPTMWPGDKKRRMAPTLPDGDTLIEAFLRSCDRMKSASACVDATSGVMQYKTMKRAVCILAKKIKELEGDYVGVMLPSSVGVYIIILAIILAKKIPVPLNWTVGAYFMNHAVDLMDIKHVITSKKFMTRLNNVDIGKALDKLLFIEDLRASLTLKEKITGAFLAKQSTNTILRAFNHSKVKETDVAIVLFTSGTTALPKAVPLTHRNILSNQKEAIQFVDLNEDDVLVMALPPFHIFGLNLGILPLLMGIRIVYTPDPLDGSTIAKEILKWRVSVVILAPTFFSHLFRSATISQLKSLRMCVSGAEKASPALMEYIDKIGNVHFLEGYGLTETSPIISVNSVFEKSCGVGKVLPSIDLITIDPETKKKLFEHQVGEICVAGPSIFDGYYKMDNTDVFFEVDGKKYYRTGDLGWVDDNKYLHLEGRLKLSFKRGGEMINVFAIETMIFNKAKEKGWIAQDIHHPPFACIPREGKVGAPKVVLFSEVDISLDQVNNALFEGGFSRLYKINEVIFLKEIPLLKSGKVCYRKLFDMLTTEFP